MRTYIVTYSLRDSHDEQHYLDLANALWSCGKLLPFFAAVRSVRILLSEMTAAQIGECLIGMFGQEDELLIAELYMPGVAWDGLAPKETAIEFLGNRRIRKTQ